MSAGKQVTKIREASKPRPDKACAIMLDTKGPEIRTGLLRNHQAVQLTLGQEILISFPLYYICKMYMRKSMFG